MSSEPGSRSFNGFIPIRNDVLCSLCASLWRDLVPPLDYSVDYDNVPETHMDALTVR